MDSLDTSEKVVNAFKKLIASQSKKVEFNHDETFAIVDNYPNSNDQFRSNTEDFKDDFPEFHCLVSHVRSITKNLRFTEKTDCWDDFYVYSGNHEAYDHLNRPVSINRIVNFDAKNEKSFQNKLNDCFESDADNGMKHIFFLSGTTGVGKTTFVKFHCATKYKSYYEKNTIPLRLRFRDLEARINRSDRLKLGENAFKILNDHLSQCILRDIVKFYRFKKQINDPIANEIGEIVNRTVESIKLEDSERFAEHEFLVNFMDKWNDDRLISAPPHLASLIINALDQVEFKLIIFLDGFDALDPELINLFGDELQSTFLECLLHLIEATINNCTDHPILITNKTSIVISCRPITVSQIKYHINADIDFGAILENEYYLTCSNIEDVVNNRIRARKNKVITHPPCVEVWNVIHD